MPELTYSSAKKTCAIMQPYLFPYIGYFQLIEKSEIFVFYDNASYIKSGWINRNLLANHGTKSRFTLPVLNSSSNTMICNIKCHVSDLWLSKLERTLWHFYRGAKHFRKASELTITVFSDFIDRTNTSIADISTASVKSVCEYIGLEKKFIKSSELSISNTKDKSDSLILICKTTSSSQYINMIGGSALYDKNYFKKSGINLVFLRPTLNPYYQGDYEFLPGLSVIDLLMHLDPQNIRQMVTEGAIT